MNDGPVHPDGAKNAEVALREQLARSDAAAAVILPTLRHLITADDTSVPSDEILARVRGMLADIVESLLVAGGDTGSVDRALAESLAGTLAESSCLLSHLHAVALEWQLAERLRLRLALDPVVSPLLQTLIASPERNVRDQALAYLKMQARWCQAQGHMKLPLQELNEVVLHDVLDALSSCGADVAERAKIVIHQSHQDGANRQALASRVMQGLGGEDQSALSLADAGVSLFLSALALKSGQPRDTVILSTQEGQVARLALFLLYAGLGHSEIEGQVLALHAEAMLPVEFERLDAEHAGALLSSSRSPGLDSE